MAGLDEAARARIRARFRAYAATEPPPSPERTDRLAALFAGIAIRGARNAARARRAAADGERHP